MNPFDKIMQNKNICNKCKVKTIEIGSRLYAGGHLFLSLLCNSLYNNKHNGCRICLNNDIKRIIVFKRTHTQSKNLIYKHYSVKSQLRNKGICNEYQKAHPEIIELQKLIIKIKQYGKAK